MTDYQAINETTGSACSFSLSNITTDSIEGITCITAICTTEKSTCNVLEWVSDGCIARGDSHMLTREFDTLTALFDLENKPSTMPEEWFPVSELFDALDHELTKR